MKAVCFFSPEIDKNPSNRGDMKRRQSIIDDGRSKHNHVVLCKQSKIKPISLSLPIDRKTGPKLIRQNSLPMVKSPISGLRQLYPLSIDTIDGESDASGYEGDTEFWTQRWWEGTQRYDQEEEDEEGLVAGIGTSSLNSPLTPIRAPLEIKKRIWLESPIWQCIKLLKECLEDKETAEKWLVYSLAIPHIHTYIAS